MYFDAGQEVYFAIRMFVPCLMEAAKSSEDRIGADAQCAAFLSF
jgi:hypothetical protein